VTKIVIRVPCGVSFAALGPCRRKPYDRQDSFGVGPFYHRRPSREFPGGASLVHNKNCDGCAESDDILVSDPAVLAMSIITSRKPPSGTAMLGDDSPFRRSGDSSLTLHCWPMRDEPRVVAVAAGAIAILVVLAAAETASLVQAALAGIALALADWRNLLPVTYVLDASGIEQRVLFLRRRIAWAAVARCEVWPEGVRLMRSAVGHPLDALRSVFIPWQGERDAILALLARRALRARLVDDEGRAVMPSTVSHQSTSPSSIPSTNPLTLAAAEPPKTDQNDAASHEPYA
jgi:hypothetical protein